MESLKSDDLKKVDISKNIYIKKNVMYTNKPCSIMFPHKFVEKNLSEIDDTSKIIGIVAVVYGNTYGTILIPNTIEVTPTTIENINIDGENYYKLNIDKDFPLIDNTEIVKNSKHTFGLFDTFVLQGKIPWYIDYNNLLTLLMNLDKYAGSNIGKDVVVLALIISLISRKDKEVTVPYRIENKGKIRWVGFNDIYYSYSDTLSKIVGSYMKKGMISSIVNPEKVGNKLGDILR